VSRGLLPQVLLLFIPAKTELRARLRRFARVEEGTSLEERICLPKSGPTQPAYLNGKNGLENDLEASWRDSISDLQLASRLLYSSQRGRPGCCSAARKRHYQLGMVEQVRNAVDKRTNGCTKSHKRYIFVTAGPQKGETQIAVCN
jgi:hypothetical protein